MHITRSLLALLAVGLAGGCMKKASMEGSSAPPSYDMAMEEDYGSGGYDEVEADFDDYGDAEEVMAKSEPREDSPAVGGMRDRKVARKSKRNGIAPGGQSAPEPAPAAPAEESGPEPEPTKTKAKPGSETKDADEPESVARQIIYTAEMRLSVFNVEEAMQRVEALAISVEGYVQQMRDGYFILRIPAPRLRDVMDGVGGLGMVTQRSLEARDVTEEYVDVSTRIRVLRETQGQLIALLKKTKNVEEALHVRQALDQVTMQLEQALGRLRVLESLIGFSTLTVYIQERGPQNDIPSSNDPFPWVDSLGVEATEWN